MEIEPKFGVEELGKGETVIVDYGGANVAKPLHVGHLRSAIIGESVKRMGRFLGYHNDRRCTSGRLGTSDGINY